MAVNKKRQGELKAVGALLQNDKEHFAVRFLSRAGNFTTKEIEALSIIANKYGRGYMGLTTRLQMEIPWIKDEDIETALEEAESLGLRHGGTGKKIRPLVACKGTVCLHGNIDTQKLCRELEDKYFAKDTLAKFKINVVGCANNCAKANINDIGIIGRNVPEYVEEKCVGCSMCTKVCRQKALTLENKKIIFDRDKCVECGDCIRECKVGGFISKEQGAEIFVGGRFGREMRIGNSIGKIVKEDEIIETVDKIIAAYEKVGNPGERLSKVVERVGVEEFIKLI
ncbi:anaerobic sulfite reductase subunit C [Clostridium bornimense]|uniref:Anaerobic sulfite reductase subunit C n=1 Tax=Clostridium bornimense TaxID=1216932 RepID=W6S6C5_9CLOT|nr:4Fe-4S binding protein [Clostridium bornimense]CDM69912.1 anaerobic sulfite reductase subunit C [Clostridium bornimense]